MSQAIAYILRSRGFKAGPYKVGYQSCDDSIARTGSFGYTVRVLPKHPGLAYASALGLVANA